MTVRPTGLLLLLIIVSLTLGCSGPLPQRINLQPEVISVPRLPQSIPVNTRVTYPSEQLKIGTVADRLGNEVPVWVTDNLKQQMSAALNQTLTRMGVDTRGDANAQLTLSVEDLSYILRSDGLRRELIGNIQVNLQVTEGQRQFQGRFESDRREEILRTPSEEASREFINSLASDVLFQALNDPEFTRFLIAGVAD